MNFLVYVNDITLKYSILNLEYKYHSVANVGDSEVANVFT
jgi:hypothetical protein